MNLNTTRRKTLIAAALLLATPLMILAKGNETRLRTSLTGGAIAGKTPSGHAEYRVIASPSRAKIEVEVEDVNLEAGTVVDVFVDDVKLGSIKISAAPERGGELELNTQDGQAVPVVKAGAVVVVRNGATAILSGVLN